MYGNPFMAVPTLPDFLQYDRKEILEEIAQVITLLRPDHRDLHGLPEMGKSALLRYLTRPEFIEEYKEKFWPPYKEKPHRLFFVYLSGWINSMHPVVLFAYKFYSRYEDYRSKMLDQQNWELPELLPQLPPRDKFDDDSAADAILEHMEPQIRLLADQGVRPVFLFDEFDKDEAFGRLTSDQAARLSTWMPFCAFIFTTERLLEEVNPNTKKGSPLFQRLPQMLVREFSSDEAREFLHQALEPEGSKESKEQNRTTDPEGSLGVNFTQNDIAWLVEMTGGFPFLLTLAGRTYWNLRQRMARAQGSVAQMKQGQNGVRNVPDLLENVRNILQARLLSEFSRPFRAFCDVLDDEQRQILTSLARRVTDDDNKPPTGKPSEDFPVDRFANRLSRLEQYGLVRFDANGHPTLFSPLFAEYLRDQEGPAAEQTELELTDRQRKLYDVFRRQPEKLLTFAELGHKVWNLSPDRLSEDDEKRKIHIAVSKLRRQLEEAGTGERIVSQRAKGYRFEPAREPTQ